MDGRYCFFIRWKPADILFRHGLPTNPHRKLATATHHEFGFNPGLRFDERSHTGRSGQVVSNLAVPNADALHEILLVVRGNPTGANVHGFRRAVSTDILHVPTRLVVTARTLPIAEHHVGWVDTVAFDNTHDAQASGVRPCSTPTATARSPSGPDVNADSFFVVMPQGGQMTTLTLRVPYPLGFAARAASGRIDDPNAGWKGRGFWSSYSMYTPWHQEGGKGTRPKVVKFQVRPTPLAK